MCDCSFIGLIYCFNVAVSDATIALAADSGVEIRYFNIIYRMIEDLKMELSKRLPLLEIEDITGKNNFYFCLLYRIQFLNGFCLRNVANLSFWFR